MEDSLCNACNGSGEGRYDGTMCSACHGTGSADEADRRRDEDDERAEYYAERDRDRGDD